MGKTERAWEKKSKRLNIWVKPSIKEKLTQAAAALGESEAFVAAAAIAAFHSHVVSPVGGEEIGK